MTCPSCKDTHTRLVAMVVHGSNIMPMTAPCPKCLDRRLTNEEIQAYPGEVAAWHQLYNLAGAKLRELARSA